MASVAAAEQGAPREAAAAAGGRRLERRQTARGDALQAVRGLHADLDRHPLGRALGLRHVTRVLVGRQQLLGDPRPGVALGARARRWPPGAAIRAGSSARSRSVSASFVASARGTSRPSTPLETTSR